MDELSNDICIHFILALVTLHNFKQNERLFTFSCFGFEEEQSQSKERHFIQTSIVNNKQIICHLQSFFAFTVVLKRRYKWFPLNEFLHKT